MDKYIGRLLDNRYEILEVIGTGGMAVVYKARCHRLNRLVAIKILKDDYLQDEEFRRRFHSESQAVAMLSHPNIVSVYDVSTSIMADYIVMELIEGITLKQYMEKKGILNWKETLHFAMQIAKALEHAHSRGIVHRDIKPHNVMVLKNGSVKVTDFGIARMMSKGNTLTKEALGSVHYISPEQAKGGRVDSRSDIYSLGVVMYEMMAGRPPYDGDSPVSVAIKHINGGAVMPSTLNPNIPDGLEQIIMKAMAHEICDRYVSATRMLSDMDEFRKDPTLLFDYNTPPLDAVTKMPPPLVLHPEPPVADTVAERTANKTAQPKRTSVSDSSEARRAAREREARRRQQQEEEKRSRVATIAIITCSVVAVVAIVIFMVILLGNGGITANTALVEVPDLVGQQFDPEYTFDGLSIVKDEVYDDEIPAGQVISQKPEAGEKVSKDSKLVLKVSLGPTPEEVALDDLINMDKDWVITRLESLKLNLDIKIEYEFHDEIAEESVIRTDPAKSAKLTTGQTVTLYVSKGPEVKTGQMPNVLEMSEQKAVEILDKQKLNLKYVTEQVAHNELEEGYVVKTEPAAGEELKTGQTVKIYVSKGAELVKMPNLVKSNVESAITILREAGFDMPSLEYVDSEEEKGTVIEQSHKQGEKLATNTEITLKVSTGKKPAVTKDVTIQLEGTATENSCRIIVKRDGKEVYNAMVTKGTTKITISGQSGSGNIQYDVVAQTADGQTIESWTEFVKF